jgi:hypothetical protein
MKGVFIGFSLIYANVAKAQLLADSLSPAIKSRAKELNYGQSFEIYIFLVNSIKIITLLLE